MIIKICYRVHFAAAKQKWLQENTKTVKQNMFNVKNVNAERKKCMNVVAIEKEQKNELQEFGINVLAVARNRRIKNMPNTEWCKTEEYVTHTLNTDKIENLDDCKKIVKFLCDLSIKPLPQGVEYGGFSEVEKYFD